jgi:hypothetical protein
VPRRLRGDSGDGEWEQWRGSLEPGPEVHASGRGPGFSVRYRTLSPTVLATTHSAVAGRYTAIMTSIVRRQHGRLVASAVAAAALTGCGSFQAYEGPRLPSAARALIHADPAFSAGLPVQVILRKVDDREIPVNRATVAVEPGRHQLIVDCRHAETGASTRFVIDAEVEAGSAYRLEAEATGRGCVAVTLRPR